MMILLQLTWQESQGAVSKHTLNDGDTDRKISMAAMVVLSEFYDDPSWELVHENYDA